MPTLFVRLGEESVACQTFVPAQCRGLIATGMLVSPTSLVPLLDMDLQVLFECERDGTTFRAPACLTSSQLTGTQPRWSTVVPSRHPRRIGVWTATWLIGEHVLAKQRIRGISQRHFQRSLRLSDTRFVVQNGERDVLRLCLAAARGWKAACESDRASWWRAASREWRRRVAAGSVAAQVPGAVHPPLLLEQQVRITDGPTMVAPGTMASVDLQEVTGFEVSVGGCVLGTLSLCPIPAASFTAEGGFKPPADYTWNAAAEEEMNDRLNRLLEG